MSFKKGLIKVKIELEETPIINNKVKNIAEFDDLIKTCRKKLK